MFWQRTLSAFVLISLVLSGLIFTGLIARFIPIVFLIVVALLGVVEACKLLAAIGLPARGSLAFVSAMCLCASAALGRLEHLPMILAITMMGVFIIHIFSPPKEFKGAVENVAGTLIVLLWEGLPLAMALDLFVSRDLFSMEGVEGRRWLKLLFAVVWSTDSFAYMVGKSIGRRKLTPISPKKTWEGAFGGLIGGGILIPVLLSYIFPTPYPHARLLEFILVSCGLSVLTQLGDLAESLVKRQAGFKDSGTTYTGHGGILDIMDGLLFASAGLWCYVWIMTPHVLV